MGISFYEQVVLWMDFEEFIRSRSFYGDTNIKINKWCLKPVQDYEPSCLKWKLFRRKIG